MLVKDSSVPLYRQLKNKILEEIESLDSDSKISSEREYSEKYDVSRLTVRHAIDELAQEKYLIRISGKGTYVSKANKSSEFLRIVSFTNDMQKQGYNVYSKVLKFKVVRTKREVAENLKINVNDKVFRLNRIRFANNIPMAIQDSYIIYSYCPTLLDYDFSIESLYGIIENVFSLKLSYANNILEARLVTEEEIKVFNIKKPIPVFVLDQTTFLESGKPIEFVRSIYRSDKYKFFNIAVGREIKR